MNCNGHVLLRISRVFSCQVIRKINRFVVEALSPSGNRILAHNTNTGRLEDILFPGSEVYCAPRSRPGKTTHYIIGSSVYDGSLINTRIQERAFMMAVEKHLIPWLTDCKISKYQPRIDDSKFDFELECNNENVILELKSAVLRGEHGEAMYPDCPTIRGRKHIYELAKLSREGYKTAIVFIAGFPGANRFRPYVKGDPVIKDGLIEALKSGVLVKSIGICIKVRNRTGNVILYSHDIPIKI